MRWTALGMALMLATTANGSCDDASASNLTVLCNFIDRKTVEQLKGREYKADALRYAKQPGIPEALRTAVTQMYATTPTQTGKTKILQACANAGWSR